MSRLGFFITRRKRSNVNKRKQSATQWFALAANSLQNWTRPSTLSCLPLPTLSTSKSLIFPNLVVQPSFQAPIVIERCGNSKHNLRPNPAFSRPRTNRGRVTNRRRPSNRFSLSVLQTCPVPQPLPSGHARYLLGFLVPSLPMGASLSRVSLQAIQ